VFWQYKSTQSWTLLKRTDRSYLKILDQSLLGVVKEIVHIKWIVFDNEPQVIIGGKGGIRIMIIQSPNEIEGSAFYEVDATSIVNIKYELELETVSDFIIIDNTSTQNSCLICIGDGAVTCHDFQDDCPVLLPGSLSFQLLKNPIVVQSTISSKVILKLEDTSCPVFNMGDNIGHLLDDVVVVGSDNIQLWQFGLPSHKPLLQFSIPIELNSTITGIVYESSQNSLMLKGTKCLVLYTYDHQFEDKDRNQPVNTFNISERVAKVKEAFQIEKFQYVQNILPKIEPNNPWNTSEKIDDSNYDKLEHKIQSIGLSPNHASFRSSNMDNCQKEQSPEYQTDWNGGSSYLKETANHENIPILAGTITNFESNHKEVSDLLKYNIDPPAAQAGFSNMASDPVEMHISNIDLYEKRVDILKYDTQLRPEFENDWNSNSSQNAPNSKILDDYRNESSSIEPTEMIDPWSTKSNNLNLKGGNTNHSDDESSEEEDKPDDFDDLMAQLDNTMDAVTMNSINMKNMIAVAANYTHPAVQTSPTEFKAKLKRKDKRSLMESTILSYKNNDSKPWTPTLFLRHPIEITSVDYCSRACLICSTSGYMLFFHDSVTGEEVYSESIVDMIKTDNIPVNYSTVATSILFTDCYNDGKICQGLVLGTEKGNLLLFSIGQEIELQFVYRPRFGTSTIFITTYLEEKSKSTNPPIGICYVTNTDIYVLTQNISEEVNETNRKTVSKEMGQMIVAGLSYIESKPTLLIL
jgi:hypothetical protein